MVTAFLFSFFFLLPESRTCTTRIASRSSKTNGANPTTRASVGQNGRWCSLKKKTYKVFGHIDIDYFFFPWPPRKELSTSRIYSKKVKKEKKEMMLYKYKQEKGTIDNTKKKEKDEAYWSEGGKKKKRKKPAKGVVCTSTCAKKKRGKRDQRRALLHEQGREDIRRMSSISTS